MRWFNKKTAPLVEALPPDGNNDQTVIDGVDGDCSKEVLKEQALLILTILSVVVGIGVGIGLRSIKCSGGKHRSNIWRETSSAQLDERINGCRITREDIKYIDFPGKLFINVLKMLILPLIVSSIISALSELDAQSAGKMGLRALVYYISTTLIAAVIGVVLVLTIRPGTRGGKVEFKPESQAAQGRTVDTVLDLFTYAFDGARLFHFVLSSSLRLAISFRIIF
jgi:Na+/H+-dicarboxylate symporter